MTNDATRAQNAAANPQVSTWLGANAGSGKTRVLTDRVARMLLDDVNPERILCLTYTKAAAMEMQNRLFKRLGAWAMQDDDDLRTNLSDIGVPQDSLTPARLMVARTLFARAIEAPGGLKIQTIHSFCASVLRRFPLEAQVSPAFKEIDDRLQKRLILDLLDKLAKTPEGADAITLVARELSADDGLLDLSKAIARHSHALTEPVDYSAICTACGVKPELTESDLIQDVFLGSEGALAKRVLPHLDPDGRSSKALHNALRTINFDTPMLEDVTSLESVLLAGATTKTPFAPKIDGLVNKAFRATIGDDAAALNDLCQRIADARPLRTGLITARRTYALHRFAAVFLPAYAQAKQVRGWLDFDDLINGMNRLLADKDVAQWVLFRLDGGIDHILVDEAQDTSPRQWKIIEKLAEGFAHGEGARANVPRTIFVVGDKKQSIYSFQGADPAEFDRMREHFRKTLADVGAPFEPDAELLHSFRSAPPILDLVDRVATGLGAPGLGQSVRHVAFNHDMPGRIDIWPLVEKAQKGTDPAWYEPLDLISEDHHAAVLARSVAINIQNMLTHPPRVKGEALGAGDILILVRRRSALFSKIIAELKARDLPVAGIDRSQLTTPLAVQDLLALCRFLATPEDDLSLAAVLRSPLCNLTEAELFDLAHGRGKNVFLVNALRDGTRHGDIKDMLEELLGKADFLKPFDLLQRVLIRHDGRRRLTARLGPEAEDAIDAMLAQALNYEASEVPSLTGFVGWLESGEVEVKRDLSQPDGQIRVMTVHGAKGLEAPVVILPDCAQPRPPGASINIYEPDAAPIIWAPRAADESDLIRDLKAARKAREAEESNRLLYVALTRAESWLIVAAAGQLGKEDDGSWYKIVSDAAQSMPSQPLSVADMAEPGLRIETGDWSAASVPVEVERTHVALPDWVNRHAPRPARDIDARRPSDLGGAKALPGQGDDTDDALARGRVVHLLLEHLPRLPQPAWPAAAPGIAARDPAAPEDIAPLLAEATDVLTAPHLAAIFAPDTLAEVEVTGHSDTLGAPIIGQIDRLIVGPDTVTIVDFKTNRHVPDTPNTVPEGLLRQMGAYAEMLKPIYPNHKIQTAILWSRTAQLMDLPHDLVSDALKRARGA